MLEPVTQSNASAVKMFFHLCACASCVEFQCLRVGEMADKSVMHNSVQSLKRQEGQIVVNACK
jgi:hypothetical protein